MKEMYLEDWIGVAIRTLIIGLCLFLLGTLVLDGFRASEIDKQLRTWCAQNNHESRVISHMGVVCINKERLILIPPLPSK